MSGNLPVIFGSDNGEGMPSFATLSFRREGTQENGNTHWMWYVGGIVHDGVVRYRNANGDLVQKDLPSGYIGNGMPAPWGEHSPYYVG